MILSQVLLDLISGLCIFTMELFALTEMITLALTYGTIQQEGAMEGGSGVLDGVKDVFKNWWLTLRCSSLGAFIGMIPGLGGTVECFVAYGYAVQTSKYPEKLGIGVVEDVIAPERVQIMPKKVAVLFLHWDLAYLELKIGAFCVTTIKLNY